jgi:ATP-dependent protease Clp ATPase subunit
MHVSISVIDGTSNIISNFVFEEAMLDIMFEVPSMTDIDTCIITDDVIKKSATPIFKMLKKQTA